jgi:hypothetical protein
MIHKKKFSLLVVSIMLVFAVSAIVPQVSADDGYPHKVKGVLYIDDVTADSGVQINIEFSPSGDIKTNYTYEFNKWGQGFNFNIGFKGYEGETAYFKIKLGGKTYEPVTNKSIVITSDVYFFLDLHINTSSAGPNNPPNTPSNPNPSDGSTNVKVGKNLGWSCSDPDGDSLTYDVYFGTTNPPPLVSNDQLSSSYDPGTMSYLQTYYWQIEASDGIFSTPGSVWQFTTKEESSEPPSPPPGGGGVPGGGNQVPTADAGGPYVATEGEVITFDGSGSSDPEGSELEFQWDFNNDGTYETTWSSSATATHSYPTAGNYKVTLMVRDDIGAADVDTTSVEIVQFNNPPTTPVVGGPETGNDDTSYSYTAVSTDADDDTIQYMFIWGDGSNTTTSFVANGTQVSESHSWSSYGFYTITVTAEDSEGAMSAARELEVAIDVMMVDDIGYLIDTDSDGTYDSFHSDETGTETDVEQQTDETYLLNSDEDEQWDWEYDAETDTLTEYSMPEEKTEEDDYTWVYLLIIIIIILLIIIGAAMGRKKKPAPPPEKPKNTKNTKKTKK